MANYTHPSTVFDADHDGTAGAPDPAAAVAAAEMRMQGATHDLYAQGAGPGDYIKPIPMNNLSTSASASENDPLKPTVPPGL